MLTCKIYRGQTSFEEIIPFWKELENAIPDRSYAHSPIWNRAYFKHLADDRKEPLLFSIWENETLLALCPFELSTVNVSRISFSALSLSQNFHYLLPDILFADRHSNQKVIDLTLRELKRCGIKWDTLFFPRILESSVTNSLFTKYCNLFCHRTTADPCNTIPIEDYEKLHQSLAGIFRGTLKKAKNKLNKQPDVQFVSITKPQEIGEAFNQFLEVEASGWKGKNGKNSAILLDQKLCAFYGDVIKGFASIGQAEINMLKTGEKLLAAQYAIGIDDTLYLLKIGYDQESSKLSPGNLLLEWLIKRCHEDKKYRRINLITNLPWQDCWNPVPVTCYNFFLCNNSPRGLLLTTLLHSKKILEFFQSYRNKKTNNDGSSISPADAKE